ncbi:MAG: STAS domain-containing protein [Anaerolineales bacterium]|nr:STAS domain-containing protein [Anaerolineales bacterium]
MSAEFQINISQQQGRVPVTIFHLQGDVIDANTYDQVEAQVQAAFESGARNLLLDLTKVRYISSAGLRALHGIFLLLRGDTSAESNQAMKKGLMDGTFKSPHLKLLNPSPACWRRCGQWALICFWKSITISKMLWPLFKAGSL